MKQPNVFLLTVDETRPDDLGCHGQKKIKTPAIDSWAEDGVIFEETRAVAPFTPVCLATVLSGTYPNKHGRRDSYKLFTPPMTLAEIMKINGYKTAAFSSAGNLGPKAGYDAGFDVFSEPNGYMGMRPFYPEYDHLNEEEFTKQVLLRLVKDGIIGRASRELVLLREEVLRGLAEDELIEEEGDSLLKGFVNPWIRELIPWLEENKDEKFFVWCHYIDTHVGNELFNIHHGFLKEGEHTENNYHLGKVLMFENVIVKSIIETMKKLGIYDNTIMVLESDHGTHLSGDPGSRPMPPLHFASYKGPYPGHSTLYDADVRIINIWRGPGLPKSVRVEGQVRTVDTIPTLLDLLGIEPPKIAELDGVSLMPFVKTGKAEGLIAYMEHLHEGRVFGCQQAICDGRYKFIRSLTTGSEELFDLKYDPNEYVNLLNSLAVPYGKVRKTTTLEDPLSADTLVKWRRTLNHYLLDYPSPTRTIRKPKKELDKAGRTEVDDRLRSLGYIQ